MTSAIHSSPPLTTLDLNPALPLLTTTTASESLPTDDEQRRKLLKPNPTQEQVLDALRRSYYGHDIGGSTPAAVRSTNATTLTAAPASSSSLPLTVEMVKELDSYDDRNYLVAIDGRRYVAKIHNGVETDEYLRTRRRKRRAKRAEKEEKDDDDDDDDNDNDQGDAGGGGGGAIMLQNCIFTHLSDPKHGVTTSVPIPPAPPDGSENDDDDDETALVSIHSLPVASPHHSPRPLALRLLTYVEGTTLSSVPRLPIESLFDAGSYLGKVRAALDDLASTNAEAKEAAMGQMGHAWDTRNTCDLVKYLDCIDDLRRRELARSVLDAFRTTFGEGGSGGGKGGAEDFAWSILMGDYNDANILVTNDEVKVGSLEIAGIIDFGDSTYSWRVLDVTIAMAYAMISSYGKGGRMLSAAAALLRGLHSIYPLTLSERRHLRLLISCRLACSVSIGAYSYKRNPENVYLLFHAEPAWRALELLWGCEAGRGKGEGAGAGAGEKGMGVGKENVADAIDRLFDRACDAVASTRTTTKTKTEGDSDGEKGQSGAWDCSDISFPDPGVADPLATIRTTAPDPAAASARTADDAADADLKDGSSPIHKRQRTDDDDDDNRPTVTFVTGNKKKLEEVRRILRAAAGSGNSIDQEGDSSARPLPFAITSAKIDLPELQGEDISGIAKVKCSLATTRVCGPVIVEDTSLCFSALKNLPGPYIKWFLDRLGHDGLNDMIAFSDDKSASAVTIVAFCPGPGLDVVAFEGRTDGRIVRPRGKLDFGWDPIFEPNDGGGGEGEGKGKLTYAEMNDGEKDSISHRRRAFVKLREYLLKEEKSIKAKLGV